MNCPYGSRHHYLNRWCVLQADHDGEHECREQRRDDNDMPPIRTDIHRGPPLKAAPHEPPQEGEG